PGKSDYSTAPFKGYTQGPGYYGKTFFIWPPDPRVPLKSTGATWTLAGGVVGGTNSAQIKQFLTDFGYTAADFGNTSVNTTLSAKITNIQTTITVNTTTGFPTTIFAQFKVVVGTEIMLVTAVGGVANKTWTVLRAQDGTVAAAANSGATVGLATGLPLYGIYSVTKTAGSQIWPWPNDGGTTLSSYLTANVYKPASSTKLSTTDDAYQNTLRL